MEEGGRQLLIHNGPGCTPPSGAPFEEHCWNGWDSDYRRWRDCFSDEVCGGAGGWGLRGARVWGNPSMVLVLV